MTGCGQSGPLKNRHNHYCVPRGKTITREALIKWLFGNAQLFRLARHEIFLKQE